MDLGIIANRLRGMRDQAARIVAEGLDIAQAQIQGVYRNLGFSTDLIRGRVGILIGAIQTNILEIIGDTGFTYLRLRPPDNPDASFVNVELSEAKITDITGANADFYTTARPDLHEIVGTADDVTRASLGATKGAADSQTHFFISDVDGDTDIDAVVTNLLAQLTVSRDVGGIIQLLKILIDATHLQVTLEDGTDTTTITQKKITIKDATLSGILKLAALNINRPLKTNGSGEVVDGKISVTATNDIDVSGLTDGQLVKRSGAVLASTSDYYTKAEADAKFATLGALTGVTAGHQHTQT